MSFPSRNKLFKHLRETYRKPRTSDAVSGVSETVSGASGVFETVFEASDAASGTCAAASVSGASEAVSETSDAEAGGTSILFEKFAAPMTNTVEIAIIIHSIVKLRDIIIKPSYNFRN